MRLRIIFAIATLFYLLSVNISVYAVTPTPTIELPEVLKHSCGIADFKGIDQCCRPPTFREKVQPIEDKIADIPILGRIFNSVGNGIIGAVDGTIDGYSAKLIPQCIGSFPIYEDREDPKTGRIVKNMCVCSSKNPQTGANIKKLNEICNQYDEKSPEKDDCIKCADSGGILTGLACIKTDFSTFISEFLLRTGVGFGGIIALGCIIYASITIQTSQGNPETIQKAREQIKSCLFGLLLILFSVLILQIIGVNILGLPGFK